MDGISVIVPIYNAQDYLRQCIDSIINQTFQSLQIILINDGSTDKSGEICDEYAQKDSRIRVIHQENQGLRSATIAGITAAEMKYVAFVDSDDYILPNMYEILFDKLTADNLDGVCCQIKHFGGGQWDYVPSAVMGEYDSEDIENKILKPFFREAQSLNTYWSDSRCDKLYKKEILDKILPSLDLCVKHREDYDFNILYLKQCGKIAKIGEVLYMYRRNANSFTRQYNPKYIENVKYSTEVFIRLAESLGYKAEGLKALYSADIENAIGFIAPSNYSFGEKIKLVQTAYSNRIYGQIHKISALRAGFILGFYNINKKMINTAVTIYHFFTGFKPIYSKDEKEAQ